MDYLLVYSFYIFRLLGQFQSGYTADLERYCMKNYGLDSSQAEAFSELAIPRIATVFLEKMGSVSYSSNWVR